MAVHRNSDWFDIFLILLLLLWDPLGYFRFENFQHMKNDVVGMMILVEVEKIEWVIDATFLYSLVQNHWERDRANKKRFLHLTLSQ